MGAGIYAIVRVNNNNTMIIHLLYIMISSCAQCVLQSVNIKVQEKQKQSTYKPIQTNIEMEPASTVA